MSDYTLLNWAKQGVLMLNTSLTVVENKPTSHLKLWYEFTKFIIDDINKSFKRMNTIDISLTILDNSLNNVLNNLISSISIIDSSKEVIIQNNDEIKSAANTINSQYTIARDNIFAIDTLSA